MKKRMLFVVNPCAGKQEMKLKIFDVLDLFAKHGFEVTVYITQQPGDAKKLISRREAKDEKFDVIACSGGDGTLNEVLNSILALPYRPLLGYIPAGTVNDFASSLGLPRNIHHAADTIVNGAPFACDVGQFNNRYFSYVAAFGLFTDVSYATAQQAKNIMGRAAYIIEGIRRLPNKKAYSLKVEYNDQVIQGDFIFGMVTNSKSVAGLRLGKQFNVTLDDGHFELLLIRSPENAQQSQNIIRSLLRQEFDMKMVYEFKCSDLKITSKEPIPWTLDGEYGGTEKQMDIHILKKAVKVLVPKKRAEATILPAWEDFEL